MTLVGIDKVLAEKKNTHTQNNALHVAVQLPKEGTQVLLNTVQLPTNEHKFYYDNVAKTSRTGSTAVQLTNNAQYVQLTSNAQYS